MNFCHSISYATVSKAFVGIIFAAAAQIGFFGVTAAQALNFTALHHFCAQANCADGDFPVASLIRDAQGNLYGTTKSGGGTGCGGLGCGVVFKLNPPIGAPGIWTEQVLYSFCSQADCADGAVPQGRLLLDAQGNLYGMTTEGGRLPNGLGKCGAAGTERCGVVFQLTPPSAGSPVWSEKVLYSFCMKLNCSDGNTPLFAGLVIDGQGNLFGTTNGGGKNCTNPNGWNGCGVVFQLSPPTKVGKPWKERVLYKFKGGKKDGMRPGQLAMDSLGNIFGTTDLGGASSLKPPAGNFGQGIAFELMKPAPGLRAWREKVLYNFCTQVNCSDGAWPKSVLTIDALGNLYGMTEASGDGQTGQGTVFQISPPTGGAANWTEQVLYTFCSQTNCTDGTFTGDGVVLDSQGNLYGMTVLGGAADFGTVFKLSKPASGSQNWTESVLHSFSVPDGAFPFGALVIDDLGKLYGTSTQGGAHGGGTLFRIIP